MAEARRQSSSGVHACCCASGSSSLTVFRPLGTRAFDLLLVLLEADGALVTKKELLDRVWPSVIVSEENLKVHVSALRKALGADRDFIRTDFGRGYRFTGVARSEICHCPIRAKLGPGRALFSQNWRSSLRCSFS